MEESLEAVLTSLKDDIIPDGNKFNKSKAIVTQLLASCGGDTEEDSMLIKVGAQKWVNRMKARPKICILFSIFEK